MVSAVAAVVTIALTIFGAGFTFLWARTTNTREKLFEVSGRLSAAEVEISYIRRDLDGHLESAPDVQGRLIRVESDIAATKDDVHDIKDGVRDIRTELKNLIQSWMNRGHA